MFHFTIRDLLWLTVIVALGVGWWVDRGSVKSERDKLAVEAAKLRTDVADYEDMMMRFIRAAEQDALSQAGLLPESSSPAAIPPKD